MTLISMKRNTPVREGGPVTANIDAGQVDEWRKRGWECAEVENAPIVNLEDMTVNELRTYAKENGVNIPAALRDKTKIISAITSVLGDANGHLA